ncbi:hypothetical protein FSP39_019430 [Pinctada imbricata]|uniref:Uncharacterized protein n=1 Tax=Pinctada imbricata TaxID=66713 RepID=A0AA88Y0C0_PINIB|nr:hypothetical protein FSP39_019430 [Pinctada imbricata]
MSTRSIQDGGQKQSRRGRPRTGSNPNSRSNSRPSSPLITNSQTLNTSEETWNCEMCRNSFSEPDDKLLECQRCKNHFCTKCLGKSEEEYLWMTQSDTMWFCYPCREKVERNIIVDREIEEKCNYIMKAFEERISGLEKEMSEKCSVSEVRSIVQHELRNQSQDLQSTNQDVSEETRADKNVSAVMTELNERKRRENNMVVFGVRESEEESVDGRRDHDIKQVVNIGKVCDVTVSKEDISKIARLGKFNSEKPQCPLLVSFATKDKKVEFFRGGGQLRNKEAYKEIRIANDLTRTERENEKKLFSKAKELNETCSGEYSFRVKGPPWARRVVKVKAPDK